MLLSETLTKGEGSKKLWCAILTPVIRCLIQPQAAKVTAAESTRLLPRISTEHRKYLLAPTGYNRYAHHVAPRPDYTHCDEVQIQLHR